MSRVVFITGTSSGFGRLLVQRLSDRYTVVATLRNMDKADRVKAGLSRSQLQHVHLLQLDVTQQDTIDQAMATVQQQFGHIDWLINNAGYAHAGFFEDLTEADIRAQMDTNFFGLQAVTRAALPLLRQSQDARIVNVSSISGLTSNPFLSAYTASKWAVEAFTESLAQELALFDIKVCMVEPGKFNTELFTENVKVAEGFKDPSSPFSPYAAKIQARLEATAGNVTNDPMKVAKLIETCLHQRSPKLRNIIGADAWKRYWVRQLLPQKLYYGLIKRGLERVFKP